MVEKIKKHKFNILTYIFCAITMALFIIISFSCKTYAYTIDNNGNLVGDNLFDISKLTNENVRNSVNIESFNITQENILIITSSNNDPYLYFRNTVTLNPGTYTYSFTASNDIEMCSLVLNNTTTYLSLTGGTYNYFTFNVTETTTYGIGFELRETNTYIKFMLNEGTSPLDWEPYGVWYSETNYDTIENLYNNTLQQYNDLILANNYGYWKYIEYVEFEESNNYIYVPNTQEQNEWSITDLTNNNILKIGGYFDTFPLTIEPYQSNYNEVDTHINFKGYTPSDSLIISFSNATGCNIEIYDNNYNVFTYTITENSEGVIDINLIRKYVSNFDIYVIEMIIRPNSAEQNGIYFANNDYITAYNKGYNAATSNGDRKYIPQITELNNKIEQLNGQLQQKYDEGYTNGYNVGANGNNSLYNMVIAVADTPISIFKQIFNFNILGLDISGFIFGIISLLIIIWLIKKII